MNSQFSCLNFKFQDVLELEQDSLKIREFQFKFTLIQKVERIGRIVVLMTRPTTTPNTKVFSNKKRDFIKAQLTLSSETESITLYNHLESKINPTSLEQLPCFRQFKKSEFKYSVYEPEELFRNYKEGWRLSELNAGYEFCGTYPNILGVPAKISDNTLRYAAKFRSKGRVPALSYLHNNGMSISRSAQPLTGLKLARSIQDEKLVEACFNGGKGLVIDARPVANAMAQTAMGAGVENMDNYKNGRLVFLGIDNIHVVRDSFQKLYDACMSDSTTKKDLDKSSWLKLLKPIIDGTVMIIKSVLDGEHVLVHCSDGWDRTAQLSSLAQLCLDPFYRSIDGLSILLEKEWQAFGHKFQDRTGIVTISKANTGVMGVASRLWGKSMGGNESSEVTGSGVGKETSPVFPQFLDCMYQIWKLYPTEFEYDERILEFLFVACYSSEFSSFLFNNQKEMKEFRFDGKRVENCSNSVWQYIAEHKSEFVNPVYTPSKDVIIPHSLDLVYWARMYKISNKFIDDDLGSATGNTNRVEEVVKAKVVSTTTAVPPQSSQHDDLYNPTYIPPPKDTSPQEDLYSVTYTPPPKPDMQTVDFGFTQSSTRSSAKIPIDGEMVDLQDLRVSSQISNPLMKNPWA